MTYVDMKYNPTNTRVWVRNMSYSAWGSARLLVLFIRAMRRPQGVGRATVRLSRFFLYYPIAVEVSPKSFAITMQILRNIKVSLYTELLYLPSATQTKLLNHPMPIKEYLCMYNWAWNSIAELSSLVEMATWSRIDLPTLRLRRENRIHSLYSILYTSF